ncbi:hypothetical protein L226DRAFT_462720 [Lentinus tigrinus ALCF2SS1-7]|uniref:Glucose receptor Git3 N-terminal domain-containing protein n=1 Tax=Lentinus tigrinus ALCF2SS1-6 TaxID=1328759 RepID=A0A5C2SB11_9APHY|nr:hypothetical protein L227DRAFT_500903 [Lentinus tigrinus ALCF2SS1-6]RPD75084.1 hypothetical protein L226DRAFT_462720 [Lentinus tigrinus ALCF2SS1-7]
MSSFTQTLVYQSGQASSLIAIVLFASISVLAILAVFLRYSWDPLVALVKRRSNANQHHSRAFFHTQLGAYIASLMLGNALSSSSMIINGEWAGARAVTEGILCNTQGILSQIGDTAGAYFTGTIAIHTFNTLVLRNKVPVWVCMSTTAFGWLFAILMAATPTWIRKSPFGPVYGFDGLSCGISLGHPILSLTLHLVPLLLGSVFSVIFYTLVFLILRGTVTIDGGIKFNFNRSHRWSMSSVTTVEYQRFIAAVARSMLWYPFAYNILLLPEIIVSLTESSGINVPFQANVFASATASLLGTANALILINTLRILRPFLEGNLTVGSTSIDSKKPKDADMESFFAGAKSPMGFTPSPSTPKNPDKAFVNKREKTEWSPPPRNVSKAVSATVARGLNRVSQSVSLKRNKEPQFNPVSRAITPVAELNAMITVPEPAFRKNTLPSSPRLPGASPSLPAPRRDTRSPVVRQPTLTADPSPAEAQYTTISLKTPEPPRKSAAPTKAASSEGGSRHTSANDSILSMYLSRTPEGEEMEKPAPPPKPLPPKPRPQPMPLSARPQVSQNSFAPSPLPSLRSARPAGYAPEKAAFASDEWAERVRRGAPTPTTAATVKTERRRSRSLDLNATAAFPRTPAMRTPMYGDSLTVGTPMTAVTPRRDASLSAVSARTPVARTPSSSRRLPATPSRSGSTTPGAYGYL